MNSFNITIDNFKLRSTENYYVVAEIIRNDTNEVILQWYREENGFTFQFLTDKPFAEDKEEVKTFFKVFSLLVKIINLFIIEDGQVMRFSSEYLESFPILQNLLKASGIQPLEEDCDEHFIDLDFLKEDLDSFKKDLDKHDEIEDNDFGFDIED